MFVLLLASLALGGEVTINGVDVRGLRDQVFEGVTVHFDSEGDIHIDAPGYRIQVEEPSTPTAPVTTRSPTTTSTARPARIAPADNPPPAAAPPGDARVEAGRWWMVTEDNGSMGHIVQVLINGQTVQATGSGSKQVILDLGPYLRPGPNPVQIISHSQGAGGGGTFYVYLGGGSNDGGTITMERPQVQFGLGPSRTGEYVREYTLLVE